METSDLKVKKSQNEEAEQAWGEEGEEGDSQRELGGEGQRVAAQAAVRAGQGRGHHVLCSSADEDEERVFGGF